MTAQLAPLPVAKFFDNNGFPLAFGSLTSYAAGTTTPIATYVDSTQTTPNTNPIQLNFRGECNLWLDPTKTYKLLLQDVFGHTIPGWPVDNIPGGINFTQSAIVALLGQTFVGTAIDVQNILFKRSAAYAGGTPGFVNSALRVQTDVTSASAAAYEWSFLSIMNNSATAGNNVAGYLQGNKLTGAGPTWAGVMEARDKSGNPNPTSGLIGLEVDIFADGGDANSERVGIDIVGGVGISIGPTITYGLRIGPQNGSPTNCNFLNFIYVYGNFTRGLNIHGSGTVGVDTSLGTLTGASLRLASGQFISFDVNDTNRLTYDGTGIAYKPAGTLKSRLNADGTGFFVGGLGVNNNAPYAQVTGWGTPTGTGVIANFPGAGPASLAQCSQAIAQLITDLKGIGFYGA